MPNGVGPSVNDLYHVIIVDLKVLAVNMSAMVSLMSFDL